MSRVLALARRAIGMTSPNPMVGCVIVKNNRIIGEGYHQLPGLPHAEINALSEAGNDAEGAIMYVNLEPCCHYGRTPPCVDKIIKAKISKVIISMKDPNKLVAGKGITILQQAGIAVKVGLLYEKAVQLNEVYIKYITTGMPFVVIKAGMSIDGKIQGPRKWITSEKSRLLVHRMRSEYDAVLVGIRTVLDDNPHLTARIKRGRNPYKVIMDSQLRVSPDANIFLTEPEKVIIATTSTAPQDKMAILNDRGAKIIVTSSKNGKVNIYELMQQLAKMEITGVLIEGGARINAEALANKIVDKVVFFVTPEIFGNVNYISVVEGLNVPVKLQDIKYRRVGTDILITGYVNYG
jgi:diaminohydroxyphosphoribosylaminopyrimidine deaminase/5-amino-6-(5-phosphoribosylamino)uracil reductase